MLPGKEVTFAASSVEVKKKSVSLTGRHLGNDGEKVWGWAVSVHEKFSKTVLFAKGSLSELERFALRIRAFTSVSRTNPRARCNVMLGALLGGCFPLASQWAVVNRGRVTHLPTMSHRWSTLEM